MKIISAMDEIDPMPALGKRLPRPDEQRTEAIAWGEALQKRMERYAFEAIDNTPQWMRPIFNPECIHATLIRPDGSKVYGHINLRISGFFAC